MDRKEIALELVDRTGRGLEIGPSYAPLVPKASGARVEVVDHADRAELIAKYRSYGIDETSLSRIEEVDHVWRGGSLLDVIPERGAYDYIVASHLVEHTVDLIGFLQDCGSLLNDGGRLALVIPDKRFCFDRFQPLSSVGTVIDAHLSRASFHPAGSLLDHQAYACKRGDASIAWTAADDSPLSLQFPHLEGATEAIEAGLSQQSYQDAHRWRFVPASFSLLIHDLRALGYHSMSIVGFHDTIGFEFFVTLGKGGSAERIDRLAALLDIEVALAATARREASAAPELAMLAAERNSLRLTVESLQASRSWRLTRPLRALSSLYRSLVANRTASRDR